MSYYVFLDNSNLLYEGQVVDAVNKGLAKNIVQAHKASVRNPNWRINYSALLSIAVDGNLTAKKEAHLFGTNIRVPIRDAAIHAGFKTHSTTMAPVNKEKKVDVGIAVKMMETLYEKAKPDDIFVLIAGDADYLPVLKQIRKKKIQAHVIFFNHASKELKKPEYHFIELNSHLDEITLLTTPTSPQTTAE